jgi:hypothetical protein
MPKKTQCSRWAVGIVPHIDVHFDVRLTPEEGMPADCLTKRVDDYLSSRKNSISALLAYLDHLLHLPVTPDKKRHMRGSCHCM